MRKRRKTIDCLNCGFPLPTDYEYCPKCGQENHTTTISFGKLVRDFFDNYFSLDSRFGRSIKPFFLQPGKLTGEFIAGKRMTYANPVRLYLVISLIHFFVLSIFVGHEEEDIPKKGIIMSAEDSTGQNSPIQITLGEEQEPDSLETADEDKGWPLKAEEYVLIDRMSKSGNYSNRDILDSLRASEKPFFQRHVIRQVVKMQVSDQNSIRDVILKNIPLLMFCLLPVYALILKLFFRKRLYIMHLIHSLHIHCFALITLSLVWLVGTFSESLMGSLPPVVFLICLVYLVLSFRSVYAIRYRTSLFKVVFSGMLYFFTLIVGMLLEMILSLLFY